MWMDANALQAVESNVHLDTQAQMMYHGIGPIGGFCYFLRVQNWLWLDLIRSDVRDVQISQNIDEIYKTKQSEV